MQPEVIPIIAAAVVASITAMIAAVVDRLKRPSATICVLLAGSVQWIYMASWFTRLPSLAVAIGLFASAPLFVIAALIFKSEWRGEPDKVAAWLSAAGVIASGSCTFLTLRLMAQVP